MSKEPADRTAETIPTEFPEVTPRPSDMPNFATQLLFEMSNTLGRIESRLEGVDQKVERLRSDIDTKTERTREEVRAGSEKTSSDLNEVNVRLGGIERRWHQIQGGLALATVLMPICAAVVWWSLGSRIEEALEISGDREPAVETQAPPAGLE